MPHILVDHDATLREFLDTRRFAHELHALAAKTVDGITIESCKTRFRCVEEVVIAHDAPRQSLIHVDFAILPGRTTETKTALGQAVLDLVRAHTAAATQLTVHASVEVRDLDAAYTKHVTPAGTER
ncbi:5-carboxymethyl-2-hydroxymuconate Delta-isomerase [Streptomyces yunnanensis]|uniref:5-carboxymethyl-2-hydroxymuconate isomerase n=1 Tax=Streptomyces yunnanensis TaxID=156453 RepID=A0A9X8MQK5_9ACTN|nr:isomerase [Streptomyces yunnanensis]SHL45287.1 5-carboxymethyl-2-hydroxymuconate isomerase [Streptomyces yunnanensis]